jgi:hypothetical protein
MKVICELNNQGLYGILSCEQYAYIVRVYITNDLLDFYNKVNEFPRPIYYMSFGNGVTAEDRLLELLEHPEWTVLKYG